MSNETTRLDVAIFIDFENIYVSVHEKLDESPDFESIMDRCSDLGRVIMARAYADWYRYPRITSALYANGIEPIYVPTYYYDKDMGRTGRAIKNSVDMNMCIDAMKTLFLNENVAKFVLITGDRDFIPLVNSIRQLGKEVIIIGIGGAASAHLAQSADEFVFYEQLVGKTVPDAPNRRARASRSPATAPEQPTSPPPQSDTASEPEPDIYHTLVEAVHVVRERGYLSTLGSLKLVMKELMGGEFKESRYKNLNGRSFSKFKDFVLDAEKRGKVQIYTNGTVSEVFLPGEDARKLSQFAEAREEQSRTEAQSQPATETGKARSSSASSSSSSSSSGRSRRRRRPRSQSKTTTPPATETSHKEEREKEEKPFSEPYEPVGSDVDYGDREERGAQEQPAVPVISGEPTGEQEANQEEHAAEVDRQGEPFSAGYSLPEPIEPDEALLSTFAREKEEASSKEPVLSWGDEDVELFNVKEALRLSQMIETLREAKGAEESDRDDAPASDAAETPEQEPAEAPEQGSEPEEQRTSQQQEHEGTVTSDDGGEPFAPSETVSEMVSDMVSDTTPDTPDISDTSPETPETPETMVAESAPAAEQTEAEESSTFAEPASAEPASESDTTPAATESSDDNAENEIIFTDEEWQAFRTMMMRFPKPTSFAQIFDALRGLRQQQKIVRTNEQLRSMVKQSINTGLLERSGRGKRVYYKLRQDQELPLQDEGNPDGSNNGNPDAGNPDGSNDGNPGD